MITENVLSSILLAFLGFSSLFLSFEMFRMTLKPPKMEMDIPIRYVFSPMFFLFGLFFFSLIIQRNFGVEIFDPEFFSNSPFGKRSVK